MILSSLDGSPITYPRVTFPEEMALSGRADWGRPAKSMGCRCGPQPKRSEARTRPRLFRLRGGKAGLRPLIKPGLGRRGRIGLQHGFMEQCAYIGTMTTITTDKTTLRKAVAAKRKAGTWTSGVASLRTVRASAASAVTGSSAPKRRSASKATKAS